jgi:glyoxylase-like metal-dependent hydrolase (beta-lactamase superfamily II)
MMIEGVEVVPLCDAVGPMGAAIRRSPRETFPNAEDRDWAGLDTEAWVLHFHCYLVGGKVLVDTGIGGVDSPAASWAPVPGVLHQELAGVGVTPADIDVVVLTHLHSDHASGATTNGRPAFPNARYVLQQQEVDWAGPSIRDYVLNPLTEHLHIVDGDAEIAPGITVHHTPGHTPGHQVARVGDLTMTGDVVLHPVQLANPKVTYIYDEDPEQSAHTRIRLLDQIREVGGSIATAHFANPFTKL